MNIDLGNYVITSDESNIILNLKRVTKEGKNIGTAYLKPIGYYSDISSLVRKLLLLEIQSSDAKTLKDILELLNTQTVVICKAIREVH
jgi:hypothetical protein